MRIKHLIAAAASVAFMATPTIASAQQAPRSAAATEVAPAGEPVSGSELHGDYVIPLVAVAVLLLIIILASDHHHHHDNLPTSP